MHARGADVHANPLSSFRHVKTGSIELLEHEVGRFYPGIRFELDNPDGALNAEASRCELSDIALTYGRHGTGITIDVPYNNTHSLVFAYAGSAEARTGRLRSDIAGHRAFVASATRPVTLKYAPDFEQLILNVSQRSVTTNLEALIGAPLSQPIIFKPTSNLRRTSARRLWEQLMSLVERLGRHDGGHHQQITAELEQAIILSFLTANESNYTPLLMSEAAAAGRRPVHKVADYLEAYWDQPLTVEMLARVSGVSVRTLFHSFRGQFGYSPMEFVRRIRLERARQMLAGADPALSVTSVALSCGFGNLGHFAGYYKKAFGEAPSATLSRARSPASS